MSWKISFAKQQQQKKNPKNKKIKLAISPGYYIDKK